MSVCPVCQASIEITEKFHGALFTCPHCNGVYFIGWDGQPEGAPPAEEAPLQAVEPPPAEIQSFGEAPAEQFVAPPEEQIYAPVEESGPEPVSEAAAEPAEGVYAEPEPEAATPVFAEFADVVIYANDNEAASGPLTYTLQIRGLELADTFEKLREALTDSRFGWDVEEVMGRVSAGELVLPGLNPTKASILVGRIKYLPIELEWTQEVFGGA